MPATYRITYDRTENAREINAQLDCERFPDDDAAELEELGLCYGCGYSEHECACDEYGDDVPDAMVEAIERKPGDAICLCCNCREMLVVGDDVVQNPVFKCGELSYIELAHRNCLPEWAANDDWQG